ncbi:Bromodomain adjacent to zinc finger domain protein 2B [Manis javanica]|nr:Bromodomain adjacent to zinc finger domain protein 2B [Manis javanica]
MDFSTIREKLISGQYPNLEAFAVDVRLVFDNCEAFNQDDSDTGRAGHSMRKYFEKKWTDTLKHLFQVGYPLTQSSPSPAFAFIWGWITHDSGLLAKILSPG